MSVISVPVRFKESSSWTVDTIKPEDYLFKIPDDGMKEVMELASFFDTNPIIIEAISADDFEIPALHKFIADVEFAARKGPRFALIDRLPLDDISKDAAVKIYWVLMSLFSRPVAQTLEGRFVFPVEDTGRHFFRAAVSAQRRPIWSRIFITITASTACLLIL